MNIIKFTNVEKYYNKNKALDNMNWIVKKGEIHSLLGHNGAGKTTAFLIANNLIPFEKGKVEIEGKDVSKLTTKDMQNSGLLTEKLKLYDSLSVKEILNFFCGIFEIKDKKKKLDYLISTFGLNDFLNKKIKELSTGMYKKLAISLTVINDPEIIFLDEPFAGLDPSVLREISKIIKYYKEDKNKTVIISSHNLYEVEAVSEKITIIKDGKTIVSEDIKNLFKKYKLSKSFMIEYLEDDKEKLEEINNEEHLFNKLKEIKEKDYQILSIKENKISLKDIYNNIYAE